MCKYGEVKLVFIEIIVSVIDINLIYLQKIFKGWEKMNQKVEVNKILIWLLYLYIGFFVKKVFQYIKKVMQFILDIV